MSDWNDLKYFLAVARHGSTLAASKVLRVSQSTVHRRVEALEKSLGRRLVKRLATGYRLTELGEDMRAYAEVVEDAVAAFKRRVNATETELTGTVRVTCAETVNRRWRDCSLLTKSMLWTLSGAPKGLKKPNNNAKVSRHASRSKSSGG
jgi:DNA-binding transcriptional LysR family regulator